MDRSLEAPALDEVARAWWDRDVIPVIAWNARGDRYELCDPEGADRIPLVRLTEPSTNPRRLAAALAEGLAACDFPPTQSGPSASRVQLTLRAAGLRDDVAGA